MFDELDASSFSFSKDIYTKELEIILKKIVKCYQLMLNNNTQLFNDENKIRDILLIQYLKKNTIRRKLQLTNYLFEREVPEDLSNGRVDIKICTLSTFQNTEAYFTIECKRLDNKSTKGRSGLNSQYILNGIKRFTDAIYSSHYKSNAMIGFVVAPLDIHQNINDINFLLKQYKSEISTVSLISRSYFVGNFEHQYFSIHKTVNNFDIKLYHLMFDFSKSIIKS